MGIEDHPEDGHWHNHEESLDSDDTIVRHAHSEGETDHTHVGKWGQFHTGPTSRMVHPRNGRLGMSGEPGLTSL